MCGSYCFSSTILASNECEWNTKLYDGLLRVKRAEATYPCGNVSLSLINAQLTLPLACTQLFMLQHAARYMRTLN